MASGRRSFAGALLAMAPAPCTLHGTAAGATQSSPPSSRMRSPYAGPSVHGTRPLRQLSYFILCCDKESDWRVVIRRRRTKEVGIFAET
ncbi:Protein of unknown function, partial [Gryllus bimaculatus]